jgi:hypothetical protein
MTIEELKNNGTIKFLFDRGFIPSTVMDYFNYKVTYDKYRVKHSYREACELAADEHGISSSTIKRALMALKR